MKKSFIFATLAVAMVTVSCSQDESLATYATSDANAIGFKSYVPKSTRGTAINNATELQATDFDVFAFDVSANTQIMGTASDGVKIAFTSGAWDYDQASEKAYWSDEAIDFYAVSPETLANLTKNFTYSTQTLHYEASATCADQKDVMYASVKNATKGDRAGDSSNVATGAVKFNFNHALAQIVFKVKTYGKFEVDINDIAVFAQKEGTFTYSTEAWTDVNEPQLYSIGLAVPVTGIGTTAQEIGNASNALLLIPQTFAKWSTDKTNAVALPTDHAYLKVSCKIRNDGVYIYADEDDFKDIYMPIAINWVKGNKYTYTIGFGNTEGAAGGLGFDEQGNPILNDVLITFDADVAGWTDASEDVEL